MALIAVGFSVISGIFEQGERDAAKIADAISRIIMPLVVILFIELIAAGFTIGMFFKTF